MYIHLVNNKKKNKHIFINGIMKICLEFFMITYPWHLFVCAENMKLMLCSLRQRLPYFEDKNLTFYNTVLVRRLQK